MSGPTSRLATRALGALLAFAAIVGLAAGCGGGGDSDDSSEPIKIGISLPLTGEFSQPGTAAKQGYQVWADTVNSEDGLLGRQVELDIKDDASDQNTVVADYNALISRDQVDLLMGTFSSLLNLPASAVAERNQMLYVEPAGGAPEMFTRGFQYLFFAQQATADHQGDLFVDYILDLPEKDRPQTAAYPSIDDPFAIPVIDSIKQKLEDAGIKTVYEDIYPPSTSNFDSIASAVKSADPDLIAHGAVFDDGIGFIRALSKVGFQPRYFFETSAPSGAEQFSNGVGIKNTEAIFYAVSHTPEAKTPGNEDFVAAFDEKFGGLPAEDAADAFAVGQVLQTAVEEVGSIDDQAALADYLRNNQVETILGPLEWDDTGAPQGQFLIGQWQDGKAEVILPEEAATTDTIIDRRPGSD
ncbi:MAG TPA: amino acid ABC transporter substrate-binding protein [Solirubrobacterales bacterium]|nr:amino acid ABC transporter substrate-binding protein [Solirubrobacterales bacterium]